MAVGVTLRILDECVIEVDLIPFTATGWLGVPHEEGSDAVGADRVEATEGRVMGIEGVRTVRAHQGHSLLRRNFAGAELDLVANHPGTDQDHAPRQKRHGEPELRFPAASAEEQDRSPDQHEEEDRLASDQDGHADRRSKCGETPSGRLIQCAECHEEHEGDGDEVDAFAQEAADGLHPERMESGDSGCDYSHRWSEKPPPDETDQHHGDGRNNGQGYALTLDGVEAQQVEEGEDQENNGG